MSFQTEDNQDDLQDDDFVEIIPEDDIDDNSENGSDDAVVEKPSEPEAKPAPVYADKGDIIDAMTDAEALSLAQRRGYHSGGDLNPRDFLRKDKSVIRDNESIISLTRTIAELKRTQDEQIAEARQRERQNILGYLEREHAQAVEEGDNAKASDALKKYNAITYQIAQEEVLKKQQSQQPQQQQVQVTEEEKSVAMSYLSSNSWYNTNETLRNEFDGYFNMHVSRGVSRADAIKLADKAIKAIHPQLGGTRPPASQLQAKPNTIKVKRGSEEALSAVGRKKLEANLQQVRAIYDENTPEYKAFKESLIKDFRRNKENFINGGL